MHHSLRPHARSRDWKYFLFRFSPNSRIPRDTRLGHTTVLMAEELRIFIKVQDGSQIPTKTTSLTLCAIDIMAATEKDQEQLALARKLNHIPWGEQYERMISGML